MGAVFFLHPTALGRPGNYPAGVHCDDSVSWSERLEHKVRFLPGTDKVELFGAPNQVSKGIAEPANSLAFVAGKAAIVLSATVESAMRVQRRINGVLW